MTDPSQTTIIDVYPVPWVTDPEPDLIFIAATPIDFCGTVSITGRTTFMGDPAYLVSQTHGHEVLGSTYGIPDEQRRYHLGMSGNACRPGERVAVTSSSGPGRIKDVVERYEREESEVTR